MPGLEALLEHRRDLHRQRARTARPRREQVVQRGVGQRQPVHAAVLVEALVLRADDGLHERRRHLIQRHPVQPPAVHVHAQLVDHLAVAVEQHAFAADPAPCAPRRRSAAPDAAGKASTSGSSRRKASQRWRGPAATDETTASAGEAKRRRRESSVRRLPQRSVHSRPLHSRISSTRHSPPHAWRSASPRTSPAHTSPPRAWAATRTRPGCSAARVYSTVHLPLGTKR